MPKEIILLEDYKPNKKNKNKVWKKGSRHLLINELANKLISEGKAETFKIGKKNKKIVKPFNTQNNGSN